MELDRGTLARLDRRLLARLDRDERFQMVRVPVTPAIWATWRRYCETAGISMGRAIAALIENELAGALGDSGGGVGSVYGYRAEELMSAREAKLASREAEMEASEHRMRRRSERLRDREREIEVREWRLEVVTKLAARPVEAASKTGRNERCPCESGLKYKHCHGLPRQ